MLVGQKFARVTTRAAVRSPGLWRLFRPLMRRQFDSLAPVWDSMRDELTFAPYEAALDAVDPAPRRVLDLGTGTGAGAFRIAQRFRDAEVVGADISERMLEVAKANTPRALDGRVRFERADASALPFGDGAFDLVAHANMIPFFDEVDRVLAPGGQTIFAFSGGAGTPIYVPTEKLRSELARRGFTDFADFSAGRGTALLARKGNRA